MASQDSKGVTTAMKSDLVCARSSAAQLRRAAGSPSLDKPKSALAGWTAKEIDDMATHDGKNALHLAAWKGSLENVQHLLRMGCDIDAISTGQYSYGKTPIFFAATTSRNEVVQYLLHAGAFVKIVNNKGQSPLSIASSHLSQSVISRIQEQEREQNDRPWINYRKTHSDGLEYGDLDPRFLERPLRETDNVTTLSINPTTKQSRIGSFFKRNPHLRKEQHKSKQSVKEKHKPKLTEEEERILEQSWMSFIQCLKNDGVDSTVEASHDFEENAKRIITLSEKRRQLWIPTAAERLKVNGVDPSEIEEIVSACSNLSLRESTLFDKLTAHMKGDTKAESTNNGVKTIKKLRASPESLIQNEKWMKATLMVKGHSISRCFENGRPILSLPKPPIWVDTVEGLIDMEQSLHLEPVIGMDSEWYDDEVDGSVRVSILQLACANSTWVIDLLATDPDYQKRAREFIKWLFREKTLLGFAIGHDLPKIESWLQSEDRLQRSGCLDIQNLFGCDQGLAACVSRYSTLALSKEEQCSEWKRRPLSASQLEYAGLDAAILPSLLSERGAELLAAKGDQNVYGEG